MVENLKVIGKLFLRFLLIVGSIVILASLITLGVCNYWDIGYNVGFLGAGVVFMGIGALSFLGSNDIRGDFAFGYGSTVGKTPSVQNGVDHLNEIWKSMYFLVYTGSVGAVLIVMSDMLF